MFWITFLCCWVQLNAKLQLVQTLSLRPRGFLDGALILDSF